MNVADWPSVCVVIPTLLRPQFLDETLGCLAASDYPRERMEIFVVAGSEDRGTAEIVAKHREQNRLRIRYHARQGLRNSASRNHAIRETDAEVVVFVDDDCLTHPSWIRELVDPVRRNEAEIAGGTDRAPDDDPFLAHCEDIAFSSLIGSGGVRSGSRHRLLQFCPLTCNMAMPRLRVLELGGFDETIRVAEDTDFAYKARVKAYRVKQVPEAEIRHRRRATMRSICFHNYIRGYARLWLLRRYPHHSERGFLLPSALLVAAGLLLLAGFIFPWTWMLLSLGIAGYLVLLLVTGLEGVVRLRRLAALVVVPCLVALHHFWYAVGTLHAPLTGYRKVYVSYEVNVSDPFGREKRTMKEER